MTSVADLDLTLGPAGAAYVAGAELTPPGQPAARLAAAAPVALDPAALLALSGDMDAYGRALTGALFAAPALHQAWLQARAYAHGAAAALRLRLRLDQGSPALHALRWEALRDPQDGTPLALSERVRLVRQLESPDLTPVDLPTRPELRAAVIVAAPAGLARFGLGEVDADGEAARARRALAGIPAALVGQAEGADAPRATLTATLAALRAAPPVAYLVCHGTAVRGATYLWLEQEDGSPHQVPGATFAEAVAGLARRPLLLVLVACQGGGGLGAVGPLLARAGLPAVLAMQSWVSKEAVRAAMPVLLGELAADGQIDRAVAAARAALRATDEWWVPALWLRGRDGRLWREEPPASGAGVEQQIDISAGQVGEIVGSDRDGGAPAGEPVRQRITISGGETGSIIGSRVTAGGAAPAPHGGGRAEAVARQRERLAAHRATLAHYLQQLAISGSANVRPEVPHGIREARAGIAAAKAALGALGAEPGDHPDDEG